MSNKLPPKTARQVKERVYELADHVDYLAMSRTDSGKFLADLVTVKDVGGVISQFVNKAEIRTYVKDAILNRYSKDKFAEAKPDDLKPIINSVYGFDSIESDKKDKLHLFRSISKGTHNEYVVVADGAMVKWESALKKALLFIAGSPFYNKANQVHILLMLFAQHKKITPSDKRHLKEALEICNARAFIFGEK